MEQPTDQASQPVTRVNGSAFASALDPAAHATDATNTVVTVPLLSLHPADSPRLNGEDKAHIARLAETETPLPPILVDKRTMRVIDGMHRLMAASLQGKETIEVIFFTGNEADAFLRAVQENVTHGLPLAQSDRRAAVGRIIASHPGMSDRVIAKSAGLAAKTVAAIRKNSSKELPQSNARIGMDGKIRPTDSAVGRRRAAELLAEQWDASLRDVARAAGISPTTALDVRKRLERGESPVPQKPPTARERLIAKSVNGDSTDAHTEENSAPAPAIRFNSRAPVPLDATAVVEKLLRDPSMRGNERGKVMLRLLLVNAVGSEQLLAGTVPPHCVSIIVQLASQYSKMWQDFAQELDGRARIIDPAAAFRWTAG